MSHRSARSVLPATIEELQRRIVTVLRVLPMSAQELREQVVRPQDDEKLFSTALRALRSAGAVIRDAKRTWLRAASTTLI